MSVRFSLDSTATQNNNGTHHPNSVIAIPMKPAYSQTGYLSRYR